MLSPDVTFTEQEQVIETVTNDEVPAANDENEQNKTSYFGFKFTMVDGNQLNHIIVAKRDSFFQLQQRPPSKAHIDKLMKHECSQRVITEGTENYPSMGKHDSLIHQIGIKADENQGVKASNNNDCYKISFVDKNLNLNVTTQR